MNYSLILLLSIICLANGLNLREPIVKHLWTRFKKTHAKTYLTEEREQLRLSIFTDNLNIIEKHNAEYSLGLHTYNLGLNYFADWTVEEFRQKNAWY